MNESSMPFETARGVLFIAPVGSEPPRNQVIDGWFLDQWPAGWQPVGVTQPKLCGASVEATDDTYTARYSPAVDWRWRFGTELARRVATRTTVAPLTGVRFMTGWEAADRTTRVVADRCVIRPDGQIRLEGDPRHIVWTSVAVPVAP